LQDKIKNLTNDNIDLTKYIQKQKKKEQKSLQNKKEMKSAIEDSFAVIQDKDQ